MEEDAISLEQAMTRQFAIHQRVRLSRDGTISNKHLSPDGIYEITRLLPQDRDGTFSYRVRSAVGERVVQENLLTADAPPPGSTTRGMAEAVALPKSAKQRTA